MKNPEEAIQKVLAGLREVEPPPGMERRILDRLEAPSSHSSNWNWWKPSRPFAKASFAGAIFLAGLFTVFVFMHRSARVPASDGSRLSAAVNRPPTSEPARSITLHSKALPQSPATPAIVRPAKLARDGPTPLQKASEVASFPAPPMPLTEQERLLLRMAHRRDVNDLAILNPATEAKQEAVEVAQFEDFFKNQKIEVKVETEQR